MQRGPENWWMGAEIAGCRNSRECGGSGHKVISVFAFPSLPAGQAHPFALGAEFSGTRAASLLCYAVCTG